ncbi:MAG: hypothetical protein R8P61_03335 [Bacteroidia bacterium]|nr:hypothetical protein [Bacteroidia bacterium]
MNEHRYVMSLLPYHLALKDFDYDAVVDWATDVVGQGKESESILILATFSKPVSSYDIKPYIRTYLQEQGLEEAEGEPVYWAVIRYYMQEIIDGREVRKVIKGLYNLYFEQERFGQGKDFGLSDFYLLQHAWDDLKYNNVTYYYENATLGNIKDLCKVKAQEWLGKYGERR